MVAARRPLPPPLPRRAFTLVEVLLVLSLLAAVMAMAWPALKRPMATQRLRTAADAVRAAWGRARVEAMEAGRTVLFQYAVDGDTYSIQFRSSSQGAWDVESSGGLGGDPSEDRPSGLGGRPRRLPDGVTFVSSETADETAAQIAPVEFQPWEKETVVWSEPIVFYPDGTTSDVRLVLKNQYDRCLEVSMRGLTGVVTVGDVFSGEGFTP